MVNSRKQLFTAVAMLLVAALALGTSTYAWFVSNTNTSVEQMEFNAETVDSVQIALSTDAWDGTLAGTAAAPAGFKTMVPTTEINDLYAAKSADFASVMKAASTVNGTAFYKATGWNSTGDKANAFESTVNISDPNVKAIPLFFKSNLAKNLTITSASSITGSAAPAVRAAVVVDGETKLIWAPSNESVEGSAPTTIEDADGLTKAVAGVGSVDTIAPSVVQGPLDDTVIAALAPNEAKKVMVYVWLEGCDYDCVSSISGNDLGINLKFGAQ